MLALPLTKKLLSYTKVLPLFVTSDKGWITETQSSHHQSQSNKHHHHHHLHHPKKTCWLGWERGSKTTKARLAASDATNLGVHLTHLIKKMVKMTTKISTHVLKLLHDAREIDIYPRGWRRGRWGKGSRGRGCIRHLHMRPFCNKLCCTPPDRLLNYSTHDIQERRKRNSNVQVCEDARDSQMKDELITCSSVLIAI